MRKVFRKIHLWLALPIGLLFSLVCLTGALLVFEDDYTTWHYSSMRTIPDGDKVISDSAFMAAVQPLLVDGAKVKNVDEPSNPNLAWKVTLTAPKGAAYFVNQYNGVIIGACPKLKFFATVESLHRWLLNAPKGGDSIGKKIVGWCTIGDVFIFISGIVLWWPRNRKMFKSHTHFQVNGDFRSYRSWHVAGGGFLVLFALVCALTGLCWAFPWYKEAFTAMGPIPYKAIHTGAWLGIVSKILWFVCALFASTLPFTGYYIFLKKPKSRRR